MKKVKINFIIAGCMAVCLSAANGTHAESPVVPNSEVSVDPLFTDIANNYWAKNEIMQLAEMNILKGDSELQFRPDAAITKGEAAYALAQALELPASDRMNVFQDVASSLEKEGIVSAYEEGWFTEKSRGVFGTADPITRQEVSFALIQSFELDAEGEKLLAIWPSAKNRGQSGLTSSPTILNANDIIENKTETVSRAVFAKLLHQLMKDSGKLEQTKTYTINRKNAAYNFTAIKQPVHIMKVPFDDSPIYLRSSEQIRFIDHEQINNSTSIDYTYIYNVGKLGATIELTYRSFDNGDLFIFSRLNNPSKQPVSADILQKETDVASFTFLHYDRFPNTMTSRSLYHTNAVNYSASVLRLTKLNGTIEERMIGQRHPNKRLVMNYENGRGIFIAELLAERETLTYTKIGSALVAVYTMHSKGEDAVDQWALDLNQASDEHLNTGMKEIAYYYEKRNKKYTVSDHLKNRVLTLQPMSDLGQEYVYNLWKTKEECVLSNCE